MSPVLAFCGPPAHLWPGYVFDLGAFCLLIGAAIVNSRARKILADARSATKEAQRLRAQAHGARFN